MRSVSWNFAAFTSKFHSSSNDLVKLQQVFKAFEKNEKNAIILLLYMGLTVLVSSITLQWQLWKAVAGRESGAGQQVELVAATSGWARREDTTTNGAPQAHPLHQGKAKVLCNHLSEVQLILCTYWQPCRVLSQAQSVYSECNKWEAL